MKLSSGGLNMLRTFALTAALALSVSTFANASMLPAPVAAGGTGIIKVAEECGAGWWRGPQGFCHPFATNRACPAGWHLGPEGERCWPNAGFERACPPGFHLGPEGHRCWPN
jgi:hypothetical protein